MENEAKNDPVTGIFLFSKEIKNDGQIISEGREPITHIETEKYSGKGVIKSKQISLIFEKWHQSWWGKILLGLIIAVIGSLIVWFITKNK